MAERGKATSTELDARGVQSAEYIADLSDELAKLARGSRLDLLAYLLDIASLEAKTAAARARKPRRQDRVVRAIQG